MAKNISYQLKIGDVVQEYVYPKQETVDPNIKRGRLSAASKAIREGKPIPEGLREYIAIGLDTLILNSQSDIDGDKKKKIEPFPTATRRSDFYLAQSVYLLSKVMSVMNIVDLNGHFPNDFPEFTVGSVNNYIKEFKCIDDKGGSYSQLFKQQTDKIIEAYKNKVIYYFSLPRRPIEKIDFSDEQLWNKVLSKKRRTRSS
mgnify:FL=1|jgi:hypothetical protein|tara:strand:- start:218 stop:817 length:600 start_codon:yes stop_codon:yes gene_type:complete